MGSFMSAVGGAVKTMAVGEDKPEPVLPSPAASLQLVRLGNDLTTKFDDGNSAHTGVLRDLWAATLGPSVSEGRLVTRARHGSTRHRADTTRRPKRTSKRL